MAGTVNPEEVKISQLPMKFQVRYLGNETAGGLWGIKHTRKPVQNMVERAKQLPPDRILPIANLIVSAEGLHVRMKDDKKGVGFLFKVEEISYGVQDLVYSRVFCIIVINEKDVKRTLPFTCHAFACESKNEAKRITYALAAVFKKYGTDMENSDKGKIKRFAIDLRSEEELMKDDEAETEA